MAINQPPITGDPVVDAWMLEVTRELNRGETQQTSPPSVPLITNVDDTVQDNILQVNSGTLSNLPNVTGIRIGGGTVQTGIVPLTAGTSFNSVDLEQMDYTLTIPNQIPVARTYDFTLAPDIPDTHMVFLGGIRLYESTTNPSTGVVTTRDYSIQMNPVTSTRNRIILSRGDRSFIDLDLTLTIFTATLN